MRVVTWNVNGLATTLQYHPWSEKKSFKVLLDALESDIICFQEVKCQRSKITKEMAIIPGYNAYFSFSKVKLGYSGVVVYVKDTLVPQPLHAREGVTGVIDKNNDDEDFEYNFGTPPEALDAEGRCVILDFGFFILFNIYFPNDGDESRSGFKMDYHNCVRQRIEMYLKQGRQVLLVGDINAIHEEIDHCDPKQSMRDHGITDFKDLPHRQWIDHLIDPKGPLIDMTRLYHPDRKGMFTCWNTRLNTRPANFGTRIDYTLASKGLKPWFKYSDIQANIMGSDHCPVYADFLDEIADGYDNNTTSAITSPLLSSNFPEFSNQQKKLSNYFTKSSSATPIPSPIPSSLPVTTTITQSPSSSSQSGIKRSISQSQPIHSSPSSTKRAKSNNTAKSPQKSIQSFFSMNRKGITSTTSDTILELTDTKEKETEEKEERAAAADKSEEKDVNIEELIAEAQGKQVTAEAWTSLFSAPDIPRCKVHNEPCLERTVTKKGPNLGRVFYVCAKPIGPKDGPAYEYHCDYFQWKTATK